MSDVLDTRITFALTEDLYQALHDYAWKARIKRSEAIRHLILLGLEAREEEPRPYNSTPLLLPPPAQPAPEVPTLTELAALIRKAAEVNPFVRPLADCLEGRV